MQEIVELSPADLEQLLKRLTLYASRHLHRLIWRGASIAGDGVLPHGYGAQEFAGDAITKALDGTRAWNRDVYPTLELFLCSIIRSDINHLAESLDNIHERRFSTATDDNESDTRYEPPGTEPDPVAVVIDEEWRQQYRAAVWQAVGHDTLLVDLLRCFEAAVTKPADIAQRLGRPVAEIYDDLRRFRRKLAEVDAAMNLAGMQNRRTGI